MAQQKHQKEMWEQTKKKLIFMQIMPLVIFPYGKATAREQGGQITDPIPFVSTSASAEIPQGELIDPVGQTYRRIQWRNIGLSEADEAIRKSCAQKEESLVEEEDNLNEVSN